MRLSDLPDFDGFRFLIPIEEGGELGKLHIYPLGVAQALTERPKPRRYAHDEIADAYLRGREVVGGYAETREGKLGFDRTSEAMTVEKASEGQFNEARKKGIVILDRLDR